MFLLANPVCLLLCGVKCVCALMLLLNVELAGEVRLPDIIATHMVLQCEKVVPIWGEAEAGEQVTVTFAGQKKQCVATKDGRWMVFLDPMEPSNEGRVMLIQGKNTITLEDIVVGEVWFCAGQSNMAFRFKDYHQKGYLPPKNDSLLRYYLPPRPHWREKKRILPATWIVGGKEFSAVAINFSARLRSELNRPVGLLSAWKGGGNIELWLEHNGCSMYPDLEKFATYIKQRVAKQVRVDRKMRGVSDIYNSMVKDQIPFCIKGVIWYQGEGNGGDREIYQSKMGALINGWRKTWHERMRAFDSTMTEVDQFYFAFVQLANYGKPYDNPAGGDSWMGVREAQLKTLGIKHTGMAVTIDVGEADDIHPVNKYDVGMRLALWPLAHLYEKNIVFSGPLYSGQKIEGDTIRLQFDHTGSGLMVGNKQGLQPAVEVKDGKLGHFAIAGSDEKWYWADAVIDGNEVVVSSKDVKKPVAVRYAFAKNPASANLYNKEGLPASPFRTDDWVLPVIKRP